MTGFVWSVPPRTWPDSQASLEELIELRRLMRRYGPLYELPIMSSRSLLYVYRAHAAYFGDPEYER